MKVVAIIQARMGSTRLPGKVLLDLAGEPVLARVVQRARRARKIQEVVVATTTEPRDEAIVDLCDARGWPYFRGSENDALDRYYQAALEHEADVVVRITSDCPLISPEVVDNVVQAFLERQPHVDCACNFLPQRTFPRGLDTEVMRFDALERAWHEDQNPGSREHVTPYIYRHPEVFRTYNLVSEMDYSSMRLTVDTPEDLVLVRRIYDHLRCDGFSWRELLLLLEGHPEWLEINRHVEQKSNV